MSIIDLPGRDLALREDIRLLGRILGETIRQQQGEAVFATVERIRQIAVQFRRDDDEAARSELVATLNSLSRDRTIEVVRAFAHFSHLANIAEDEHNIRSARAEESLEGGAREGTIACVLNRAKAAKISRSQLQNLFGNILVSPVLTAHPTEVRRQSVIDREMEVAKLLAEREAKDLTPG